MIERLRQRAAKARRELHEMESAIRVLERIDAEDGNPPAPAKVKPTSVADAIRLALGALGSATTSQIADYVKNHLLPTANRNTIRSTLSVYTRKTGEFVREGDTYRLAETPTEEGPGDDPSHRQDPG